MNYEATAYALAAFVVAVPAPWSGERRLMTHQEQFEALANRPRHRTPDDPDGTDALARRMVSPTTVTADESANAPDAQG